jgi:hypothetical protein
VEFLLQKFAGRQGRKVLGDVDSALVEFEKLDLLLLLPGAENDTNLISL